MCVQMDRQIRHTWGEMEREREGSGEGRERIYHEDKANVMVV